ncbi:hydrolase, alpha/beta domain protein [Aeromicrobium marinum DSM 15272]|uniref:Hydrolase, alpha/beta domain protein n=1 Tax=Aeromicrobium marinum DSM 15272 TaxID=585531 RepID=E2SEZ2_9ACTN|nr:alpha/beta hydrolase [Aeromicrobium marinum]EFQ82236.1 hydrolase, alpha/beta domain protein [Aeromicrobium marinum DSM 15272]
MMLKATTLAKLGLGAAGLAVSRRFASLQAVAPELRTRSLFLPMPIDNPATLQVARRLYGAASEVDPEVTVELRTAEAVGAAPTQVAVYRPPSRTEPGPALLWIHGGGFIIGTAGTSNDMCSWIARRLGIVVVSVDYRLAPEDPFPAGLDDTDTALQWLHSRAGELGVDPARIAVGGPSAGGGLAAALAQRALDEDLPVAFQLLVYPMLDDRTVLRSDHGGTGRVAWSPRSNRFAWTAYLGRPPRAQEPRPYAAAARRDDLRGLPPAWIGVGALDLFHAEDVDYAERLRAAGVPCELRVVPGMYHGADSLPVPSMRAFREEMLQALAAGLGVTVRP